MEKKRSKRQRQLETSDLRAVAGGVRMWRPVGYTEDGEPIYEEDSAGAEPDYGRLRVPGG